MSDRLRDEHFRKLTEVLGSITGIQLPPSKRAMIEGRLRRRVRVHGIGDLETYGRLLFEEDLLTSELPSLVDAVTTNKTDFFREPSHFDFLRDVAVPELLRQAQDRSPFLKIWSAASSIGAEAYTIAMVLAQMQLAGTAMRFAVLGTDISNEVLEMARRAVYPTSMAETIPPEYKQRYTMRSADPARQEFRIVPALRRLVQFHPINLMDETYPYARDVDIIFCRNVLIYFSRQDQARVVSRLCSHLKRGGFLILGHSESFAITARGGMEQVSQTIFRRVASSQLGEAA